MGKICFQVPPPLVLSLSFPLLFFLAMVQFLLAELNPKFSARQSVGKCTDNNWWSDVVLSCHVTRVLGPAADLCHVSCCAESTCGSVKTQREGALVPYTQHVFIIDYSV